MPENFAFYSTAYDSLPEENMRQLAENAEFSVTEAEDGGRQFLYRWPNVQVTCNEMPAAQVPDHLRGFAGWVLRIYQGQPDTRGKAILRRIQTSRLVVGVIVEPMRDEQGLAEKLLGTLCNGLDALFLHDSALFDRNARLLLAPDGSFEKEAEIGATTDERARAELESKPDQSYRPSPGQLARHARVSAKLKKYGVPTLSYALHVEDEEQAKVRTTQEVARRALVLSAITLVADGGPCADAIRLIEERDLWPSVSPEERLLLESAAPDPEQAQKLLWRLEGLWMLMWALGDLREPEWPGQMCDVRRLVDLMEKRETDPHFIEQSRLRNKAEILDALQETVLLHWAIRDAWIQRRPIPEDLDWSGQSLKVLVQQCPAAGVVAERHHALNWLTCFGGADWDDVDTPT